MGKKIIGALALVVAALGAMTAAAQAAGPPQWFSDGAIIPFGAVVPVVTKGTLTVTITPAMGGAETAITCKVKDNENVFNTTSEGGADEMVAFVVAGCKGRPANCPAITKAKVTAQRLPWRTLLE